MRRPILPKRAAGGPDDLPTRRALCVAAPATVLAAFPATGEIYRWTDAEGRLHITEQLVYRVDVAQNQMTMLPNENIRGGLRPEQ